MDCASRCLLDRRPWRDVSRTKGVLHTACNAVDVLASAHELRRVRLRLGSTIVPLYGKTCPILTRAMVRRPAACVVQAVLFGRAAHYFTLFGKRGQAQRGGERGWGCSIKHTQSVAPEHIRTQTGRSGNTPRLVVRSKVGDCFSSAAFVG